MVNAIEKSFFFLNKQIQTLTLVTNKIPLVLAPLLPLSALIISLIQIHNGVFVILNWIILFFTIIYTFLLTVSSIYFLRGKNIFNKYKRYKSNNNLRQYQKFSKSEESNSEGKDQDLITFDKIDISSYFDEFRRIGLFSDDTTLIEFQNLIINCLKKTPIDDLFKLEVKGSEAHGFINDFLIPLLKKNNPGFKVVKKDIASRIQYKKSGGYCIVNSQSLSDTKRNYSTPSQRDIYNSL